jgi:hypothetical protein
MYGNVSFFPCKEAHFYARSLLAMTSLRNSWEVRAQVTAIACSLPKQCQVPLSRWSRAE